VVEEEDPFEFRKELEKAKTFDFAGSSTVERSKEAEWIEPAPDAGIFDLDSVKATIKVQGYEKEEPPPPDPRNVKKALERSDPTADYKRNRELYSIMCPVCWDTGKCQDCKGRGRRKLIFKCRTCDGTGKCRECDKDHDLDCPKCGSAVSRFSDKCTRCGNTFQCPDCGSTLPSAASMCPHCGVKFICDSCGKRFPKALSRRCPRCGHWNG